MIDAKTSVTGEVFVVDDDESVRDAVSLLLDSVDLPHKVFVDAQAFLDWCPDQARGVLVLDIRMPGMSGLELQLELRRREIMLPIIFITGHGDIPMAVEAMRRGAVDFIRKPFRDQDLLDRIHEALSLEAEAFDQKVDAGSLQTIADELTKREFEVFARVCDGQANKVIAIELGISERTVEIHRGQVMRKTRLRSLAELVRLKIRFEEMGIKQSAR
ncbi:MAG: response regulator [Pseudomonadota bacterium]